MNKFHTTRIAIVKKLSNQKLRDDLHTGTELKVKVVKSKTKTSGKDFFELKDAGGIE